MNNDSRFIPNSFQVPNAVIDELMAELSGAELKCYLAILRKTKGWNKDFDAVSVTQLMSVTGLSNRAVIDACNHLVELNLLYQKTGSRGVKIFSVNLCNNFTSEKSSPVKKVHGTGEKSSLVTSEKSSPVKKVHGTGEKSSLVTSEKSSHTKNNIKNTIQNTPPISPQGESATPANGKINAENIPLPDYVDRETWIAYCRMRKAKGAEIKTEDTIKRCLRDLEKLCGGSPDLARAILDQSIANTYTGLFALKSLPNRTVNSSASNDPFADNGTWGVGRKLNVDPSLIPEYLR